MLVASLQMAAVVGALVVGWLLKSYFPSYMG
jgi:hypothetical protein